MRTLTFLLAAICGTGSAFAQFDYDARILDYKGLKFPCDGTVSPKLLIRNDGNVAMSGCVVETWKNGIVVGSFDWQLAIPAVPGESRQPVFPTVNDVDPGDQLEFHIISVNTIPDENPEGNIRYVDIDEEYAATTANTIEVIINTDDAPEELSWELKDAGGLVVASGGPYADPDMEITETVVLGGDACYEFTGTDSGRDLLSGATMRVAANGNTMISFSGSELTAALSKGLGTGDGTACTNGLTLDLHTDDQPLETTWAIIDQANGATVCSGSGALPASSDVSEACCLPDGCYRLQVLDLGGDGILDGGYVLRSDDGGRLIDNGANFLTGPFSAIATLQGFCLPMGTTQPIFSSCDKLDWLPNRFIVAAADPLVSAQYGITNATSGYEFWFFDPNGTYSYRRFRSHATSDGYGSGATRACHFKINGWYNSAANPHIPHGVLLNVRIRSRIAGVDQEFGPACTFKIDPQLAACPLTRLQNDPSNVSDFSCGVTREFGGSNRPANRLVAAPPRFTPTVASSAVRYQFRFRREGQCIVRPSQTSPTIHLNWRNAPALTCGLTYQVDVRASRDGGLTWCTGAATTDAATNCADDAAWGVVCSVTIAPCMMLPEERMQEMTQRTFTVFPVPVTDGRLTITFDAVTTDEVMDLELLDALGRRVWSGRSFVSEGSAMLRVDLGDPASAGVHFLVLRTGDQQYTERILLAR
ncbi:MAG TPA: hypothetical protein PKJ19_01150 [Flavobacteriales bacterium]|nr:hypothetical protein [Flavobacteriales bacterium]HNU56578.1 hypothetical protein [Flavobacteriales bacterium]